MMSLLEFGCAKTKSDLVVMPSGRPIFAFFCSPHDRRAQNSGCDYTPQSFYTARVMNIDFDPSELRPFHPHSGHQARSQKGQKAISRSERAECHCLREFARCPLGRPPNQFASADDDHCQRNPLVNARRNKAKGKQRNDHREIVRSGVAAVRAPATLAVENARHAHPKQRYGPDDHAKRDINKPTSSSAWGIHHAGTLLDVLASQSREA
jgi:hypothetical protein